jgi:hypothetical protein
MQDKIIEIITNLGGTRIEDEGKARNALATEVADMTKSLTSYILRKAMEATADAMPWRFLLEDQEDGEQIAVFLKLRKRLTIQLIRTTSNTSSCTIVNEQDRMKWNGVRRFLEDTDYLVSALEAAEQAATEPAAEQPAPAPEPAKPVPARRPTPAQRKALELIARGGVERSQFGIKDRIRIASSDGVVYADTLDVLEREGWAKVDHSTSLFHGQAVSLTATGQAHLPTCPPDRPTATGPAPPGRTPVSTTDDSLTKSTWITWIIQVHLVNDEDVTNPHNPQGAAMDASTMASLIVFATNAIDREKAARKAMAAAMTDMTQDIEPYKIRKVMEAAAEALPYRQLLEDTETVGMEAALRTLRKRLTRQLLTYSTSNSTCPLTNEAERLKWDSHRAFLVQTEVLDD